MHEGLGLRRWSVEKQWRVVPDKRTEYRVMPLYLVVYINPVNVSIHAVVQPVRDNAVTCSTSVELW